MSARFLETFSRVLVLCAHTDDEFGCAGTMVRLANAGAEIRYVALSRCELSVPEGYAPDVLVTECRRATAALGIPQGNVEIWDFPVRRFSEHRQDILERLVLLKREFAPELVLMPSSFDTHQDHSAVAAEGFRAFKHSSIFGYELPQNLISFQNSAFVRLTAEDLEAKITALSEYQSQSFRGYATAEFIRGLARVRGEQSNTRFAEAFELVRLLI